MNDYHAGYTDGHAAGLRYAIGVVKGAMPTHTPDEVTEALRLLTKQIPQTGVEPPYRPGRCVADDCAFGQRQCQNTLCPNWPARHQPEYTDTREADIPDHDHVRREPDTPQRDAQDAANAVYPPGWDAHLRQPVGTIVCWLASNGQPAHTASVCGCVKRCAVDGNSIWRFAVTDPKAAPVATGLHPHHLPFPVYDAADMSGGDTLAADTPAQIGHGFTGVMNTIINLPDPPSDEGIYDCDGNDDAPPDIPAEDAGNYERSREYRNGWNAALRWAGQILNNQASKE